MSIANLKLVAGVGAQSALLTADRELILGPRHEWPLPVGDYDVVQGGGWELHGFIFVRLANISGNASTYAVPAEQMYAASEHPFHDTGSDACEVCGFGQFDERHEPDNARQARRRDVQNLLLASAMIAGKLVRELPEDDELVNEAGEAARRCLQVIQVVSNCSWSEAVEAVATEET